MFFKFGLFISAINISVLTVAIFGKSERREDVQYRDAGRFASSLKASIREISAALLIFPGTFLLRFQIITTYGAKVPTPIVFYLDY